MILSHSCPLVKCSFYCEFDAEMIQHMDCVHEKPKQSCHICKLKVPFLADHLFSHPQHSACTIIFMDLAALHEPQCGTVTNAGSVQITDEDNSLNIDTGNSEIDFVKTLHTILDRVSLDAPLSCHSLNSTSTQVESDKVISRTTHPSTPSPPPLKLLRPFQTT